MAPHRLALSAHDVRGETTRANARRALRARRALSRRRGRSLRRQVASVSSRISSSQSTSARQTRPTADGRRSGSTGIAHADLGPHVGLAVKRRQQCRPAGRRARRRRTRAGCRPSSPPSSAAQRVACVRQQATASSKSPTTANDSAVSRTGIQSSAASSARAGRPNCASRLHQRASARRPRPVPSTPRRAAPPRGRAPRPPVPAAPRTRTARRTPGGRRRPARARWRGARRRRSRGRTCDPPRHAASARRARGQVVGLQRGDDGGQRVAEAPEPHQEIEHDDVDHAARPADAARRASQYSTAAHERPAAPPPRAPRTRRAGACRR